MLNAMSPRVRLTLDYHFFLEAGSFMFILFLPENPMIWILIVGVIFLLFGGSRLPQLAKALGQSKRSFKEGLAESEDKGQEQQKRPVEVLAEDKPLLESIDDEALFAEAHRRARLQGAEKKR
jgi:TatA/E family protein of Tat protein translocase